MLGGCANRFMREMDAQNDVAITHFSGPRVKPWVRLKSEAGKTEPLTSSGIRLLLEEDDIDFRRRFPENPSLPSTGAERSREPGYPSVVVQLVREWTEALRNVAEYLHKQRGIDLIRE